MNKKIVLAYSGGLDTSVMLHWLKNKYKSEIIACIVDVGQDENFGLLKKRALKTGAKRAYVIDAKEEFVKEYIFKAIKANAVYENGYLLGTSLARPLIAEKVIETAKKEKAFAVSHGATGKGNDQVRFEVSFKTLMPGIKIIAPWREWELKSRKDEINYARQHNIPITVTREKPYSSDANLWHISYEGGVLENPDNPYQENMFQLTVSPENAPGRPTYLDLYFEKGVPKKINNLKYEPVKLIKKLNEIAGRNAIGRIDIIENRLVGMKSRGVYESPAATVLYFAHHQLESLTLNREVLHYKQQMEQEYGKLVYYGLWFGPQREALDKFIDETQKYVTGNIKMKLYKGNIIVAGRSSKHSLYWEKLATFEEENLYNQKDAEGFINLFGLSLKVEALLRKKL